MQEKYDVNSKYGKMNSVKVENQLSSNEYVSISDNGGNLKILFIGNSITKHEPAPEIGWHGNWGMAASCEERDYVHIILRELKKKYLVDSCIVQCAIWERNFKNNEDILQKYYKSAHDFEADIIVVRIGENIKDIQDLAALKCAFEKMILFFQNERKAKIIITSLFWNKKSVNEIIKNIAEEHNYVFCDISDLEKDEKTMALGNFEHRGICVHPSDYGMKCIADKILSCIY